MILYVIIIILLITVLYISNRNQNLMSDNMKLMDENRTLITQVIKHKQTIENIRDYSNNLNKDYWG